MTQVQAPSPPAQSAVAPLAGTRSVFLYNLGAAQEFVAQARRTQDLWMGSFLVSWLTWQAMKPILERYGPSAILLPAVTDHPLLDCDPPGLPSAPIPAKRWVHAANLPNVFTAIVETAHLDDIGKEIGACLESAVDALSTTVHDRIFPDAARERQDWQDQWRGLLARLGSFWAACEVPDPGTISLDTDPWREVCTLADLTAFWGERDAGDGYGIAARAASAARGRRKQLRDFSLPMEAAGGGRCTQCGLRASVQPHFCNLDKVQPSPAGGPKVKLYGRVRPGDELCAVCLGKRLCWEQFFLGRIAEPEGPEDHLLFPSTSTISTAPFKAAVLRAWDTPVRIPADAPPFPLSAFAATYTEAVHKAAAAASTVAPEAELRPSPILPAIEALLKRAPAQHQKAMESFCRLDGALLFEPEIEALKVFADEQDSRSNLAGAAMAALRKLRAAARAAEAPNPASYYAIIAADGDGVGDWIALNGGRASGVRPGLLNGSALPTEAYHRSLGDVMHSFATEATGLAHGRLARCLYAGGDDVLILSALGDALSLAMDLNEAYFGSRAAQVLDPEALAARQASMSAVILVVHRGESLSEALRSANVLLKDEAKGRAGRNAVCVATQVRGSVPSPITMKWDTTDAPGPSALAALVLRYGVDGVSPRLIQDLERHELAFSLDPREEGTGMTPNPWQQHRSGARAGAQARLLRYLVGRHVRKAAQVEVSRLLGELLEAGRRVQPGDEWTFVARAARIAQFLAREL